MPKDYRERRIDNKPPKVLTKQPKQATTRTDPTTPEGGDFGSSDITPEETYSWLPGDGILWFLRLDYGDASPSGRMITLTDSEDVEISFSYATLPGGWVDYIYSFIGTTAYDSMGESLVTDDLIYVVWDQFVDFIPGDYKVHFDLPVSDRANVEKAIRVRGVDPADPGDFYVGVYQSPTWDDYYSTEGDINSFPAAVPLPDVASLLYGIWEMNGSVSFPAGYNSVPGSSLMYYTYTDPTNLPAIKQSWVSALGTPPLGATVDVTAPWVNGNGGVFTDYTLSALVLNGDPTSGGAPVEY